MNHKFRGLILPIVGIGALVWFLIRVIPKPSRAAYPCMRVAYPMASSFVVYLLGLVASTWAIGRAKTHWEKSRTYAVAAFVIAAVIGGYALLQSEKPYVYADSHYLDTPNQPMGVGQGIFPGRVVWSWDANATNQNCMNDRFGDAYYLPKNTDAAVVENMVGQSLMSLTGQTSIAGAWNALFVHFNERKGKGTVGYQSGERILIKTNGIGSTVASSTNHSIPNLSDYTMARTSPQPVLAILRQLVMVCGVPQQNISVGDPQRDVQNEYWDIWHTDFPSVNYICYKGGEGRVKSVPGSTSSVFYSDRGAVLRSGTWSDASQGTPITDDRLYSVIEQADYVINVGALKVHERGGMTLLAKTHFGSQTRQNALHLHNGLVNPDGMPVVTPRRSGYGIYRVLVDLMGHRKLGGNTMLFVVDGLWGGPGANLRPVKFKTAPFNNDWPSSIFVSQDQVALESVCFDFLKAEFTGDKHTETYPQMEGVDDHLHQAADSANWPQGIRYDPENDGTAIASLGVHEHWNNAANKKYSRNLGTGAGIELIPIQGTTAVNDAASSRRPTACVLEANYPNPFNPSTTIRYHLYQPAQINLSIINLSGAHLQTLVRARQAAGIYELQWDGRVAGATVSSGVYFAKLCAEGSQGTSTQVLKMLLMK